MASYTEKRLIEGILLTGTAATLYTCTAPVTKTIVKEISLCNTTAIAYTFTLHVVQTGGSVEDKNAVFKSVTIQPNETKIFGLSTVLEVGDYISAFASTTSVIAIAASGVERT